MSLINDGDVVKRLLQTARRYIKPLPESIISLVKDVKPEIKVTTDKEADKNNSDKPTQTLPQSIKRLSSFGSELAVPKIEPIDIEKVCNDINDLEDGEIVDSEDDFSNSLNTVSNLDANVASVSTPHCPQRNSPLKRPICRYFRDGFCRNGVNCKFLHSCADSGCIPELCHAYAVDKCLQPQTSKRLHGVNPCPAFHLGKCENIWCQFSHQPLDDDTCDIIRNQNNQNHVYKPVRKVLLPTPLPVSKCSPPFHSNHMPSPLIQPTRRWTEDPLIPQVMSLPSLSDVKKNSLAVKDINTMIEILADESCPDDYFDSVIKEYWPKLLPFYQDDSRKQIADSWTNVHHDPPGAKVDDYSPNRKCRRAAEQHRLGPYQRKGLIQPKKEPISPPMPLSSSHSVPSFNLVNCNAFAFDPSLAQPLAGIENNHQLLDRIAAQQKVMARRSMKNHNLQESFEKSFVSPWTVPPPSTMCHDFHTFDPRRPPPPLPLNMLYHPTFSS